MVFGFFKRKAPAPPANPLALFDGAIEAAERDAGELRKSAATLLAHRGTLERQVAQLESERKAVGAKLDEAARAADDRAARLFEADLGRVDAGLSAAQEALARASADAELLVEGARETSARVEALRAERARGAAPIAAGTLRRANRERRAVAISADGEIAVSAPTNRGRRG